MNETIQGLSEQEVIERRQRGEGNNVKITSGRTYRDIIRTNVFNLINIILFTIGAIMIGIGRVGDAVVSVGLILMNVVIGVYQEIRAKRQLDQIALLTRPQITVRRDGQDREVDPSELVIGDVVVCEPGDQIVVDGVMIGDGKFEVDESQLTGESDLIGKQNGDEVLSGSFVVTGKGMYETTRVGEASFANKLTTNARAFRVRKTPLQRDVDLVIRILLMMAFFLGSLMLIAALLAASPLMRTVQMAAVVAGLIPNGLFFMVIVAYALGALRIIKFGALIQQANSVESLSNVTVLCMDKTGTLTANKINYHDLRALALDKVQVQMLLGNFARSASVTNRTSEAVVAGLQGEVLPITDEVPFSSARKWSAIAFDNEAMRGTYVLGALEMLQPYLPPDANLLASTRDLTDTGLRVLLFAYNPDVITLHNADGEPELPPLQPLGIVSFTDELRPQLQQTLQGFRNANIELKIISGDNPDTVAALAKQAGFPGEITAVSGTELERMTDVEFAQTAAETTVFGRITPDQKERLVDVLRRQGKYVAMMGDGVNDVLSLKKADIGIAMQSGASATRGVADIVLLQDSFGALPPAFLEGQRIINGMQDILRLFLTRAVYAALLIIATAITGLGFPYVPKHASLLALLTVGIPTFALAVWARPGNLRKQSLVRAVMHFVFPAAITIFVFGMLVYVTAIAIVVNNVDTVNVTEEDIADFVRYTGIDYDLEVHNDSIEEGYIVEVALLSGQTALTSFSVLAGLILVVFVEPPIRWFVGGDVFSGDWRPTMLAVGTYIAYIAILLIEPLRRFFELMPLPLLAHLVIGLTAIIWTLLLRIVWRRDLFERFLGMEELRPEIDLSPQSMRKGTLVTQQIESMTMTMPKAR